MHRCDWCVGSHPLSQQEVLWLRDPLYRFLQLPPQITQADPIAGAAVANQIQIQVPQGAVGGEQVCVSVCVCCLFACLSVLE